MAVPHGIDRSGAAGGSGTQGMSGFLNDLADPDADRIIFWDDSDGDLDWLSLGTGLSITGTSLNISSNLQNVSGLTPTDGGVIIGDGSSFVVESGATARDSLGIVNPITPDAVGDFVVGETSSNAISVPLPMGGSPVVNGRVSLSVSGSALIITMVGADGNGLSASNALFARMPQGNPLDGTVAVRKHTSSLTMTVSHGSTLGTANGATTPLYVYLLDNSGTLELAISATYYGQQSVRSTTAEGGAGGADSFTTIYSTTARTSVPIVPILKWDCAQTSAGVWLSVTGEKQLAPGDRGWLTFGAGLTLSNAVLSVTQAFTLGTEQATTSGTAIDFTGVPSGVKRITIMLAGVSTSSSSKLLVQLGDAGGIETSGYVSNVAGINNASITGADAAVFTSGLLLTNQSDNTREWHGHVVLVLEDAPNNHWTATGMVYDGAGTLLQYGVGSKALSGVLTQVRLTAANGSDTFDAGAANFSYE